MFMIPNVAFVLFMLASKLQRNYIVSKNVIFHSYIKNNIFHLYVQATSMFVIVALNITIKLTGCLSWTTVVLLQQDFNFNILNIFYNKSLATSTSHQGILK